MIAFFTKEDLNNHDRLVHHQTKIRNPLPQKITKNDKINPKLLLYYIIEDTLKPCT